MTKALFYPRLAADGIRKNSRSFIPYILTSAGMIMMYYIVSYLTVSDFVRKMRGGDVMQSMLSLGCGVMIAFSAVFLFYTNSFLIKRRKTEFGLYNILGMGKGDIGKILLCETAIVFVISLAAGLGAGILFSKLSELLLAKMLGGQGNYEFKVETESIVHALFYFAVIFVLILINSLRQIHLSSPVELLHSDNAGEKPPKANYLFAVVGAVLLGIAYYMAIVIKNPISAIFVFFIAVLMVIAATYLLFISGSVVLCRLLQKNKSYYYKTKHFISVSQMAYRMKRNGAGLASICILSTMVLVTLSSTACLYTGAEKMIRSRYPRNIVVDCYTTDKDFTDTVRGEMEDVLSKYGETPENILHYSYLDISGAFEGSRVILDPDRVDELSNSINPDIRQIFICTVADYNRLMNRSETLSDGEAVLFSTKEKYEYDTITLDEYGTFKIKTFAEDFVDNGVDSMQIISSVFLFVRDESVIKELYELQLGIYEKSSSFMHDYYGFDLGCDDDKQVEIAKELDGRIKKIKEEIPEEEWHGVGVESAAYDRADFYAMYGGLFFLGITLGSVFICAAVLIMYYKQISEGYEDRSRFEILRKVGMTGTEIKESINSQVLTVFFLPLVFAGIHMIFAFPIVSRLLALFGLADNLFFAKVTLISFACFAIVYVTAYILTSGSYLKIVSTRRSI